MRKLILSIFIVVLSVGLVACGGDTDKKKDNNEPNNAGSNNNGAVENNNGETNTDGANNDGANNEGNADAGETAGGHEEFEDLIIYLDAMGLEPGEPYDQVEGVAESLGAEKGIILPIADIDVQIFYYDEGAESFNQEQFDEATENGEVTFDAAGEEFTIPMLMNGNLGLANYEDHYKKDELVEAFTNF